MSGDNFLSKGWLGEILLHLVGRGQDRDATNYPMMHRTIPQNVDSAEVKKPWSRSGISDSFSLGTTSASWLPSEG